MTYTPYTNRERWIIMSPAIFFAVLLLGYFVLDVLGFVAGAAAIGPR